MSKNYSQDVRLIKRKNKFLKSLGVFFLIVVVSAVIFFGGMGISNLLTIRGFTWFRNNKIAIKSSNYYAIIFGEYSAEQEALDCAIWTATSGGAAYVYNDTKYMVLGQLYDNIDSANLVVENFSSDITYPASVKQFKINKVSFKIDNLKASDKRKIEGGLQLLPDTINEVLNISNKIDTNIISNVSASSEINSLKSEMKIAKASIESINVTYANENLKKYNELFVKCIDSLDVCVNKLLTSDNYSNVCKYCACEIFFNYYDFAKKIVK